MADNSVTDADLADRVGLSRVQIYRLRTGENHPSRDTALKLAAATSLPPAVLMFGEDAA
jgi:transcriptional regulator with XRE-family HTH domain